MTALILVVVVLGVQFILWNVNVSVSACRCFHTVSIFVMCKYVLHVSPMFKGFVCVLRQCFHLAPMFRQCFFAPL